MPPGTMHSAAAGRQTHSKTPDWELCCQQSNAILVTRRPLVADSTHCRAVCTALSCSTQTASRQAPLGWGPSDCVARSQEMLWHLPMYAQQSSSAGWGQPPTLGHVAMRYCPAQSCPGWPGQSWLHTYTVSVLGPIHILLVLAGGCTGYEALTGSWPHLATKHCLQRAMCGCAGRFWPVLAQPLPLLLPFTESSALPCMPKGASDPCNAVARGLYPAPPPPSCWLCSEPAA